MRKSKKIKIVYLMLIIGSIQITSLCSAATTVVFSPTDDTMIKREYPSLQSGLLVYMFVRNAFGENENNIFQIDSLIKFDLFSIPSSAIIHSALLCLYYYDWSGTNPAGRNLTLYLITSSWNEVYVNWNTKPSYVIIPSSNSVVPDSIGQWMTWDVTSDVQYLVNERAYFGWKITDELSWKQQNIPMVYFRTKEYGNYMPFLEVTYTVSNEIKNPISGFSISPIDPTIKDTIQFKDTSYDTDGTIVEWLWNFGDGNTSTSKTPSHNYTQSGEYFVTLQVTDSDGLTNSTTKVILITATKSTPGFEFLFIVCAIAFALLVKIKRKK